jgi:hypothetical protein
VEYKCKQYYEKQITIRGGHMRERERESKRQVEKMNIVYIQE